mgnify:CR=1 FL=1
MFKKLIIEKIAVNFTENYLHGRRADYDSENVIPKRFATEKTFIIFQMISH